MLCLPHANSLYPFLIHSGITVFPAAYAVLGFAVQIPMTNAITAINRQWVVDRLDHPTAYNKPVSDSISAGFVEAIKSCNFTPHERVDSLKPKARPLIPLALTPEQPTPS